jgi:DNA-binding transcriptional ArsR family regulator
MAVSARTDLGAMRALSHPLRLELLDRLRTDGPATASLLAERIGESSGATSYHLRQLARYGFVEEDVRDAKGRERWWRHRDRCPEPEGASFFSSRVCRLTPERLAELNRSIQSLTDGLAEDDDPAAPDARPVRVLAVAFPQPDPAR